MGPRIFRSLVLVTLVSACTASGQEPAETSSADEITTAPPAPVCDATVDYNSDALNCGTCGNVCASGLCSWGVCADDRAGHLFVIGNGFRRSNPSFDRILGNSMFLKEGIRLNVVIYRGTNPVDLAVAEMAAINRGARLMRRAFNKTILTTSSAVQPGLATADVLVIEAQPQLDDFAIESLADEWNMAIDDFTRRGGIVIVLDAPSTVNHGTARVLGNLMSLSRAEATGTLASVTAAGDQAVGRVPLTFALGDSVGYRSTSYVDAATTDTGAVIVAHRTVQ